MTDIPHYRVSLTPLRMRVSDEFPGGYALWILGVRVAVSRVGGGVIWAHDVWQRGTWLPFRPFYDRRLARAKAKAERIAAVAQNEGDGQ